SRLLLSRLGGRRSLCDEVVRGSPTTGTRYSPRMRSGRILLVDDDAHILRVLGMSLRAAGFEGQTAEGATDALPLSAPNDFAAIVVVQGLHEGTGIWLVERILAARPQVPLILSSGNSSPELSAEAHKLGARTLEKPYPVSTLLTLLEGLGEATPP